MKTNSLPIKALLAVIAAIAFLPVSPAAASIAFTVAGLSAMFLSDYGREIGPLQARADIVPFALAGRGSAALDRAA
jgi:hypothetical protein